MKKIILISPFFNSPAHGGGITLSRELCEEWLRRGYEVHVLGVEYGRLSHPRRNLFFYGVIKYSDTRLSHRMDFKLKNITQELIGAIQPQEIHIHNFHGMLGALWAAVESGVKSIYTALDFGLACQSFYLFDSKNKICNGPEPTKCLNCVVEENELAPKFFPKHFVGITRAILKRNFSTLRRHLSFFDLRNRTYVRHISRNLEFMLPLFEKFDHVVAPSPPMVTLVSKYRKNKAIIDLGYPVAQDKIDRSRGQLITKSPSEKLKVFYLGNFAKVKGWSFFLDVLEGLPDNLDLEVVDGSGNVTLENLSTRKKRYLKESKRLSSDEISKAFLDSDALLVPSLWQENTPLVILESLANGCPVIASNQLGISHMIHDSENGFLLQPGDLKAWSLALIQWSQNPQILREMRAECAYTLSVSQYIDALEKAIL